MNDMRGIPEARAIDIFLKNGGTMRMSAAILQGVHRRTLYQMRDNGTLEQLARGLFRLAQLQPLTAPDLSTAALKIPNGVVCLVSALSFHEMTTQIPKRVDVAIPWSSERPRLTSPPVRVYYFGKQYFNEGIEQYDLDGTSVRIYCRERTLADCFKYRRKIGMDVVLEALDLYTETHRVDIDALLRYARICRVENVMRPYLDVVMR